MIIKLKEEKSLLDINIDKKRSVIDYLGQPVSFLSREKIKDSEYNLERFVKIRNSASKNIDLYRENNIAYGERVEKQLIKYFKGKKSKTIKEENLKLRKELEELEMSIRQLGITLKRDVEDIESYFKFLKKGNEKFQKLEEKNKILDFYTYTLQSEFKDESLLLKDSEEELKKVYQNETGKEEKELVYKSKIFKLKEDSIKKVKYFLLTSRKMKLRSIFEIWQQWTSLPTLLNTLL